MSRLRRAFSIAELVIIVLFIGILAAISVPKINFAIISKQKADTVSEKIVTDLRRTRRLAIANAATNNIGFSLEMTGSSPYDGYEIRNLQSNTVVNTYEIDSQVLCEGDNEFKFGPIGNYTGNSDDELNISSRVTTAKKAKKPKKGEEARSFTITFVPATGMVKCVEN